MHIKYIIIIKKLLHSYKIHMQLYVHGGNVQGEISWGGNIWEGDVGGNVRIPCFTYISWTQLSPKQRLSYPLSWMICVPVECIIIIIVVVVVITTTIIITIIISSWRQPPFDGVGTYEWPPLSSVLCQVRCSPQCQNVNCFTWLRYSLLCIHYFATVCLLNVHQCINLGHPNSRIHLFWATPLFTCNYFLLLCELIFVHAWQWNCFFIVFILFDSTC